MYSYKEMLDTKNRFNSVSKASKEIMDLFPWNKVIQSMSKNKQLWNIEGTLKVPSIELLKTDIEELFFSVAINAEKAILCKEFIVTLSHIDKDQYSLSLSYLKDDEILFGQNKLLTFIKENESGKKKTVLS